MDESSNQNQLVFNSESLDSKISRLLTLQEMDHESRIMFRKDISKQIEILSSRIDNQGDKINKNIEETTKQNEKLENVEKIVNEVDEKLKFTNGKIANAMIQIKALETKNEADKYIDLEVKQLVSIKQFVQEFLFNKYALIAIIIFVVGTVKVATNSELRELLIKLIVGS